MMDLKIIENSTFERNDFTQIPLAKCEYENCNFIICDFSNSTLAGIAFLNCRFSGCNLSMTKLTRTVFRDAQFLDCKMLGLHFGDCVQIGLTLNMDNCNLSHSSFYKTKLKNSVFKNSRLHELDFTESDLSNVFFSGCDLNGSLFDNTNMEKADLRTAFNYNIDPERNRIKKAKFSLDGVPGLLNKYDIQIER
jgi:fluoroquinolone resistance protein